MQTEMISISSLDTRRRALEENYKVWSRETLHTHFEKICEQFKDRDFINIQGLSITYSQIWENANAYAKSFLNLGVNQRDHIAVLMENHQDYVSLLIASSLVGAVFIPINTMLKKEELAMY